MNNPSAIFRKLFCVTLFTVILAACSDDDNSSEETNSKAADNSPPQAVITFPLQDAKLGAQTTTVSGRASDASEIQAVRVNGVEASSSDGFKHWTVEIPTEEGTNNIVVETEDVNGNVNSQAAQVSVNNIGKIVNRIVSLTVDPLDGSIVASARVGEESSGLLKINPATGIASDYPNSTNEFSINWPQEVLNDGAGLNYVVESNTLVTVNSTGETNLISNRTAAGSTLSGPRTLIPDSNNIVYVSSRYSGIYSVNSVNGERTILSTASPSSVMYDPIEMVLDDRDTQNKRLIVYDGWNRHLVEVAVNDGTKTIIANNSLVGNLGIYRLAYDKVNNFLYFTSSGPALMRLDLNTLPITASSLTTVASLTSGAAGLVLTPDATTAYVLETTAVSSIDLTAATPAPVVISDANNGTGNMWLSPAGLELSADGLSLYVGLRTYWGAVYEVDLSAATLGNRTVLTYSNSSPTTSVGSGPRIDVIDLAVDAANNQLLLADANNNQIVAVDLSNTGNGNRTLIANNTKGYYSIGNPTGMAVTSTEAIVASYSPLSVTGVDLITGQRRTIASNYVGNGASFASLVGLGYANDLIYVFDTDASTMYSIDPLNGDRTVVSSLADRGAGADFGTPSYGLALDTANNRGFIADTANKALLAVDLASGDRSIVSGEQTGEGESFRNLSKVAYDSANNSVLLIDDSGKTIVSVNPENGNRSTIYSSATGSGPLAYLQNIEFDAANQRLVGFGSDADSNESPLVVSVDVETGARNVLSSDTTGTGPMFGWPDYGALDAEQNRLLGVDNSTTLFAVNLNTGNRTILSGWAPNPEIEGDEILIGEGPVFDTISGITLDLANQVAYVVDEWEEAVFSINLQTGDRQVISSWDIGNGEEIYSPEAIAYDPDTNTLYITNSGDNIMEVDIETGDRLVISGESNSGDIGWGPRINRVSDLEYNAAEGVLYAMDSRMPAIMIVDPISGDRTPVAYNSRNQQQPFSSNFQSFSMDTENNRVYVLDSSTSIRLIDKISGQNMYLSNWGDTGGFE